MSILILLLIKALEIYLWLIIGSVVVSWLVVFGVLNTRNKWVFRFCGLLNRVVDPPMAYLRRFIPAVGGIDLTPMVMIFGIYIVQGLLYGMLR